jgi:hypothetical protein
MGHPQTKEPPEESPIAKVRPGKVVVGHNRQPAHSGVNEAGEVEARGDAIATLEVDQLRSGKPKLEVSRKHLLDGLTVTEDMSGFGARLSPSWKYPESISWMA